MNTYTCINYILPINLQKINKNILYYIGSFIVKKLNVIDCYNCIESLTCKDKYNDAYCESFAEFVNFSSKKDGLIQPSNAVFKILLETERQIQIQTTGLTNLQIKNLHLKILNHVRHKFVLDANIFPHFACDDDISEIPHKIRLITAIAMRYIKIRSQNYAKFYVNEMIQTNRKHHRLTKQILFLNE